MGVELSDSAYVAVNMKIMTRMGRAVYDVIGADGEFVPCMHTVGAPLAGQKDETSWPATPRPIHRALPRDARIWSTARATAATPCWAKCLALRIASTMGA